MESTFEKVREILVEALSVETEEITPEASLYQDLGAESIDLLDITFRLERGFGIKIDDRELFPTGVFGDSADYVKDGVVTPAGMAKLKEAIPFGDFSKLRNSPRPDEIPAVFTVNTLVKFVEHKVGALNAS
jgi:acyl carrier protein